MEHSAGENRKLQFSKGLYFTFFSLGYFKSKSNIYFYFKIYIYIFSINMSVKRGHLVAVVGTVGCGKSSLVQAILGEMHKCKGSIKLGVRLDIWRTKFWPMHPLIKHCA